MMGVISDTSSLRACGGQPLKGCGFPEERRGALHDSVQREAVREASGVQGKQKETHCVFLRGLLACGVTPSGKAGGSGGNG